MDDKKIYHFKMSRSTIQEPISTVYKNMHSWTFGLFDGFFIEERSYKEK